MTLNSNLIFSRLRVSQLISACLIILFIHIHQGYYSFT